MFNSTSMRLRNHFRWPLAALAPARVPAVEAAQGGAVSLLHVSLNEGEHGPVLALSGEADLTTLGELNGALEEQIRAAARLLTVDLSMLRYADSASIAALVRAARTLREQGGELELLHPQQAVARILSLTGVDQVVTIRCEQES